MAKERMLEELVLDRKRVRGVYRNPATTKERYTDRALFLTLLERFGLALREQWATRELNLETATAATARERWWAANTAALIIDLDWAARRRRRGKTDVTSAGERRDQPQEG